MSIDHNFYAERAALAASSHYARRLRQLDERDTVPGTVDRALSTYAYRIIDRARSAELRDPEPSPYTIDR